LHTKHLLFITFDVAYDRFAYVVHKSVSDLFLFSQDSNFRFNFALSVSSGFQSVGWVLAVVIEITPAT
jgi:hypothetical protein